MNIEEFKKIFANCELKDGKIIIKNNISEVLCYIKNTYKFNILKEIVAIDNKDNSTELLYRLHSTEDDEDVVISINVQNETESVCKIFDSACADEKEIYDLFGIKFIGNDELKRLYMPESWEGHPLKKDYVQNDERLSWND